MVVIGSTARAQSRCATTAGAAATTPGRRSMPQVPPMPPMPLMPMSRCCGCFRAFPAAVRGILFLTLLEAACAFGYSIYIVVIVSSYETDSREEYFGAGFLSILAAALLLFVATAVQRENSYEPAAANLISMSLCLGPLLILFKQVRLCPELWRHSPRERISMRPPPVGSLCGACGSPTVRGRPVSSRR